MEEFTKNGGSSSGFPWKMPTTLFGIEFVDFFHIPLKRRIQTLVVAQWIYTFFFLGLTGLFLFIFLLFGPFLFIPLLYIPWYVYDYRTPDRGGRRSKWVRNWKIWQYFRDYFPVRLIKTEDLNPEKNYLLIYHPHGITASGAFLNFCTESTGFSQLFPGIKSTLLVLRYQFMFPLCREYAMALGSCCCSKESIEYLLTKKGKGNALALVVGGASEALEANPGNFNLTLNQRKGFVRIALQHGTSLVPVFAFGENNLYLQMSNPPGSWLRRFQVVATKFFSFSPPVFHGRGMFNYTFGFLPFRRPNNVVVGSPLDVPCVPNPTNEQVNEWHQKYMKHLSELFEANKTKYDIKDDQHLNFI